MRHLTGKDMSRENDVKRMTDERIAEFDGIFIDSEGYGRELVEAVIAERAIVNRMKQLVGEMQESECGQFLDSVSNDGWCRARNFYSREIQAIIRQAK